jgi:hypothetical protein
LGVSWVEGQLFGENNRGAMGGLWEGKEASAGRGNPQLRSGMRLDGALTVVDDSKALSQRTLREKHGPEGALNSIILKPGQ